MFRSLIRSLRAWRRRSRKDHPLIIIEISKSALLNNLHAIQSLAPQWQVAPVLKSNAYGHGLALTAAILQHEGNLPFFCVDSYFEARMLRNAGILHPTLVLGFTPTNTITQNKYRNISFTIASLDQLKELSAKRVREHVHIKFDTGMHRQGVLLADIENAIEVISQCELFVEGVFSHLADAEIANSDITRVQIEKWNTVVKTFRQRCPQIRFYHLANSAGFGHASEIEANVGRIGIALYGINPGNLQVQLLPALRMQSIVSGIRVINAGEIVGYNGIFTAQGKTATATIPVGYYEGVDRMLSNQGHFLINGIETPLIGRVSMNMSSCDVTNVEGVCAGSSVTVISSRPEHPNSIENVARTCGTIPYEILVHIPTHLHRVVVL